MSNVTILPIGEERIWNNFAQAMDDRLQKDGLPADARRHVYQSVRAVFFKHCRSNDFTLHVPPGPEEAAVKAASTVADHFHEIVGNLLREVMDREVDLYRLKHVD